MNAPPATTPMIVDGDVLLLDDRAESSSSFSFLRGTIAGIAESSPLLFCDRARALEPMRSDLRLRDVDAFLSLFFFFFSIPVMTEAAPTFSLFLPP